MKKIHSNIRSFMRRQFSRLPISDRLFRSLLFFVRNKRRLNLDHPMTFTDKLNYLIIHSDFSKLTHLVDKFHVREFVKKEIGEEYLNQLFGIYINEDEIDFNLLPNQFVLKATHASGMILLCFDKESSDFDYIKKVCRGWLASNYYFSQREANYSNVIPRILCEKLLLDKSGKIPLDFKFFCFHGKVRYIAVDIDRFTNHTRNIYTMNWELMPYTLNYPTSARIIPKPDCFGQMVFVAEKLSSYFPFVRVDLYQVDKKVLFGELTFTPYSAVPRVAYEFDLELGKWLNIDSIAL